MADRTRDRCKDLLWRLCDEMDSHKRVKRTASKYFGRVSSEGLLQGRSGDAAVAACIYAAYRKERIPMSSGKVAQEADVPEKKLLRMYQIIKEELDLTIIPEDPIEYVPAYVQRVNNEHSRRLSHRTRKLAHDIVQAAKEADYTSGRQPGTIAASAIYIAARREGDRVNQSELADVAGISEITIRTTYQELETLYDET